MKRGGLDQYRVSPELLYPATRSERISVQPASLSLDLDLKLQLRALGHLFLS